MEPMPGSTASLNLCAHCFQDDELSDSYEDSLLLDPELFLESWSPGSHSNSAGTPVSLSFRSSVYVRGSE